MSSRDDTELEPVSDTLAAPPTLALEGESEEKIYELLTGPGCGLRIAELADGVVMFRVAHNGVANDVFMPAQEAVELATDIACRFEHLVRTPRAATH